MDRYVLQFLKAYLNNDAAARQFLRNEAEKNSAPPWPAESRRTRRACGGELVLLEAELYSSASSRHPSGGSIGAVVGPCIEGNRRAWGSLTNSVDDDFE
jgi:hypothetical protein